MKLKRVGEPEVSPDGKWVIFSVVDVISRRIRRRRISGSCPGGGRSRRRDEIIADQDADRPRWAPDGKRFAFLSTKEGGSQVWIADFDGAAGTVTRVDEADLDRDGGRRGTVVAGREEHSVYVGCLSRMRRRSPAERRLQREEVERAEQSKVKALIFTICSIATGTLIKKASARTSLWLAVDACVGTAAPRLSRRRCPRSHPRRLRRARLLARRTG